MNRSTEKTTIAIIPARGGSKGIPGKNICTVGGKTLIARAVEACKAAKLVDKIIVSTDDNTIADAARQSGAQIVMRPADISGDTASSEAAILHALNHLIDAGTEIPSITVFVQCTAPFTHPDDIDGTVTKLLEENADTSLAVTEFHHFLWHIDSSKNAVGVNHDKNRRLLRQESDPQYLEAGSVYAMRTNGFLAAKHRFFGKTVMHVVPQERLLEIDDPVDLDLAEARLGQLAAQDRSASTPQQLSAVIFDFDGVFTDNGVFLDKEGSEFVRCNRSDGLGIERLKKSGTHLLVLSSEENSVVSARCAKLGIECVQDLGTDKLSAMLDWCQRMSIKPESVAYVGNDDNDVACLQTAGCAIATADAYPSAKAAAQIVLDRMGGHGAVREVCDMLLRTKENNNEQQRKNRREADRIRSPMLCHC